MLNKKYVMIGIILAVAVIIAAGQAIGSERIWGMTDETVILKDDLSGEIMPELIVDPTPVFIGNKDLDQQSLFDIDLIIDIDSIIDKEELKAIENAELQRVELLTYQEYAELVGGDAGTLTPISPERLVWFVEIYYPDGFDHVRVGLIENAVARGIYDAETGEYFGQEIVSLNK